MNADIPIASDTERSRSERFNRECGCATLDKAVLADILAAQTDGAAIHRMVTEDRPHLFADSPVFVPQACLRQQAAIIAAVERVVALPAFHDRVLGYAPATARHRPGASGVFLGYDFHLSTLGSKLIEINTNAGGGLLTALLNRAQTACGKAAAEFGTDPLPANDRLEEQFIAMFRDEWSAERTDRPLRTIAIVDDDPAGQFLFPEFLLFRNLFEAYGIAAVICDPGELDRREQALWRGGLRVDLVYNRLVDFGLLAERNRPLREAWLAGEVVVTPHPHAHAVFADKRNLVLLSDEATLIELGVDAATRAVLLAGLAHTVAVRPDDADALWNGRRNWFFKPAAGYGSKAAYRGDKLTKRVFAEILESDYVAQATIPPSERELPRPAGPERFKLDLRNFVYRGRVQATVARLYQGQTTNFRTPGGGFAPVVVVPEISGR